MKSIFVILFLICSVALNAQNDKDYRVSYIAEKFTEIHSHVLAGTEMQIIAKNLEDMGCLMLEDVQDFFGDRLLSYVSHSDIVTIDYSLCFGKDNRLRIATMTVLGMYHTISYRDIEEALTRSYFYKNEKSYGVVLFKNKYSKTKAVISKANNGGYCVSFTADDGFQYIPTIDYEKRLRDEQLKQKIKKIKYEGVVLDDSLKMFLSEQIALRMLQRLKKYTSARVEINDDVVVSDYGLVTHKVNVLRNESRVKDEDLKSSIRSFKMPPQTLSVEDTILVVTCHGTISTSCDWRRKIKLTCKDGEIKFEGQDSEFYDRHSVFIKEYLRNRSGECMLDIGVIKVNGTPMYFVEEYNTKQFVIDSLIAEKTSRVKDVDLIWPKFLDGDIQSFSVWTNNRLIYPEIAKENGIQGEVHVAFTINQKGNVCNVSVINEVDKSLAAEAIRVVSSSPKWAPMYINGNPEPISYTIKFYFYLR